MERERVRLEAIEDMAAARAAAERGAYQEAAEILGNTLDQRKGPKFKTPSPLGDTLHGGHHQRHHLDPRLRLSSCPSCAPTSAGPVGSRINNEWASAFVTAGVLDIVQTFSGTEETKNFCMTLRHEGNLDFSHRSLTPLASNVDGMAQSAKKFRSVTSMTARTF